MRWSTFACVALLVPSIGTQAADPAGAASVAPAPPAQTFSQLPNVSINYYDVSGADISSINRSLREQRGAALKNSAAAASDWNLVVRFDKRTTGEQCLIADATIEFSAKAALPRLVNEQAVSPGALAAWRKYVAALESESVAKLWFVFDRIDEIEQAFEGKSCEQGKQDGGKAIAQLEQDYATFALRLQTTPLALSSASPTEADKIICKTLGGDRQGKRSKPVCLSNRDWATLGELGE